MTLTVRIWMPLMLPFIRISLEAAVFGLLQPLAAADPSSEAASPSTEDLQNCTLDLSHQLFGGVEDACQETPRDLKRCCPVLDAWLIAAYRPLALEVNAMEVEWPDQPELPDELSQKCMVPLQSELQEKNISLKWTNESCDPMCECKIRLRPFSSLRCPAAFNSSSNGTLVPAPIVRDSTNKCRNSSNAGCTLCLKSLEKVKEAGMKGVDDERARHIASNDCLIMSLTWLLRKNKTAYISTVSAVLRATKYTPAHSSQCSADEDDMPLAVNSLQIHNHARGPSSSTTAASLFSLPAFLFLLLPLTFFIVIFFLCRAFRERFSWGKQKGGEAM